MEVQLVKSSIVAKSNLHVVAKPAIADKSGIEIKSVRPSQA